MENDCLHTYYLEKYYQIPFKVKKYPLRDSEIPIPENWKSEFRYSEIAYFVLDNLSISVEILVKTLPHLRCVAAFTNILIEIIFRYAQK